MKRIKLLAEYGGTVIWNLDPFESYPMELDELPISDELRSRLRDWADEYDSSLNTEDPSSSDVLDEKQTAAFYGKGMKLWIDLKNELGPDYKVFYFSEIDRRLHD